MSKKVTISVSDELYDRMQKWKDSLNFSGIFQEAVSNRIEKKEKFENFKQQAKENIDMDKTIERLRKQRNESLEVECENGKHDGYEYAKVMSYDDFQNALSYETTKKKMETYNIFSFNPCQDECFGDYFEEQFETVADFGWEKKDGESIPNVYFREWEEAFIEGILVFWNEIKDKL